MENSTVEKSVCIFCGASAGQSADFTAAARTVVERLVENRFRIVYGGGNVGLMGVVADTALAAGGEVVGVIPEHLMDRELAHSELTKLVVTGSMAERKTTMADLSDGFVALPGGLGTLEELSEVISAAQLGLHAKPCLLLNINNYWDELLSFVDNAVACGFVQSRSRDLFLVESEPELLADRMMNLMTEARSNYDRWSTS